MDALYTYNQLMLSAPKNNGQYCQQRLEIACCLTSTFLSFCQMWGHCWSHTDMSPGSSEDPSAVVLYHLLRVWGSAQYRKRGQCGPHVSARPPALSQVGIFFTVIPVQSLSLTHRMYFYTTVKYCYNVELGKYCWLVVLGAVTKMNGAFKHSAHGSSALLPQGGLTTELRFLPQQAPCCCCCWQSKLIP